MALRLLDLFSGIGGFSLAARMVGGFKTVQFVEREPFCQRILHKHWPDVPIHDDICTFNPESSSADVVCGGFPCQDISTAGKRAGIQVGTRSGLFYELIRVVRVVRPRYVVLENVAAIVSNGLNTVLGELAEAGYDCEWACIRASDVGACHRRDRWWAVAYPSGIHAERWGTLGYMAGTTGEGEGQGNQWQRDGDATQHCGADAAYPHNSRHAPPGQEQPAAWAEQYGGLAVYPTGQQRHDQRAARPGRQAESKPGDGAGANAADPNYEGLERRQPAGMCWGGPEWTAWPGDSPAGRLTPDWRSYVSEPCLLRGDDGLSGRVDRLKALGNAVVPQVAAIPLARVRALEN